MSAADRMTLDELRTFIAESTWTFAKTMPEIPHEYTLLKNARSETTFKRVVRAILIAGYDEFFYATRYRYVDVDGWQYWVCVSLETEHKSTLINRARLNREERPYNLAAFAEG